MRTEKQIIKDKILLLYLISLAKKINDIEGNLKLQKLVFLTEWKLMDSDIKAFHFKFFRYRLGPFSKELLCDYNNLKEEKYLKSFFNLTEKAVNFLEYALESIKNLGNNSKIIDKINEICTIYSKYTGIVLTNKVYNMEIEPYDLPGQKMKIKDIPTFFDILVPENFEAKNKLEIPDFLLEDIKQEFENTELTQEEENNIMEESENRMIELILNKTNISEKNKLIQSLINKGVSERLLKKFT